MAHDRRSRYRVTFTVRAREEGPPLDEEELERKIRYLIRSLGQQVMWEGKVSRSSVDFSESGNVEVSRVVSEEDVGEAQS